jgi:hypothetical protein
MLLVLFDIERKHGIPPGTMRSAISRGIVQAEKKGGIVMVDDENPTFIAFKQSYRPRSVRASSTLPDEFDAEPNSSGAELFSS